MTYFPKKTVIVPVDFSPESLAAVEVGRQLVDSPQHLHVVHVLIDIAPLEAGEVWGAVIRRPALPTPRSFCERSWPRRNMPVRIRLSWWASRPMRSPITPSRNMPS